MAGKFSRHFLGWIALCQTAFVGISRRTTRINGSAWSSLCYIELYLFLVSSCRNFYNILLVALDRYISIVRPLRYHAIVTTFRTTIAIVVVWCVIIGENILIFFAVYGTIDGLCTLGAALPAFMLQVLLLRAIGGTEVLCGPPVVALRNQNLTCYPQESQTQQRGKLKQRKMMKTMAYVLGPFLFCFYSTMIYNVVISNLYNPPLPFGILLIRKITVIIFWVQSLITPFVFGWHNQSFKRAYRKMYAELRPPYTTSGTVSGIVVCHLRLWCKDRIPDPINESGIVQRGNMYIKCVWDLWCKNKGRGSYKDGRQSGRLSHMWCMVAFKILHFSIVWSTTKWLEGTGKDRWIGQVFCQVCWFR